MDECTHQVVVGDCLVGKRLDQALAALFPDYSRTRLQGWMQQGRVTLNGSTPRQRDKVKAGDRITLHALFEGQVQCNPQNISLDIVFEDEHLLVINKPANFVVHPAAGNPDGTLQNALLYYNPKLIELPRAGIVHRLDKDTTGLMVVAKTTLAQQKLVAALASHAVKREYLALVNGKLRVGNTIDAPIGRHPTKRVCMAVHPLGKPSVTHYRVLKRLHNHTLLKVQLETGRTHQIRVHMASIRHPVFGDPLYAGRLQLPAGASDTLIKLMRHFKRQALHAKCLELVHPATGDVIRWESQIPDDMTNLLDAMPTYVA